MKCDVEVRASLLHGDGVFAARDFSSGELIGVYEGRVVTSTDSPFTLWLEDAEGRFFGIEGDGQLAFMNHADDPNALVGQGGPFVYSRRPIPKGAEITMSYGEDWKPKETKG